jgi:hypothetical protein
MVSITSRRSLLKRFAAASLCALIPNAWIKVLGAEWAANNQILNGKEAILKGPKKTVEAISKVNGITLHSSGVGDDVSYAEFTFDFETKDGNHIVWHEVILSKWKNGHIVHEEYFKGL